MRIKKLIIIILVLASLVPVYFINKWLQKIIAPKKSFMRLILYMILGFGLIFFYTFLISSIIFRLFPVR